MNKKIKIPGIVDVTVLGIVMLVCLFLPNMHYTYKKVKYTLSGFDFLTGGSVCGGKVVFGTNLGMLLVAIGVILILIGSLIGFKKKNLGLGLAVFGSIIAFAADIYFTSGLGKTFQRAKKVGVSAGNIVLIILALIILVRCLIALYQAKKISALDFMAVPGMLYFFINNYIPMVGIVIAFKKVDYSVGIFNSPWAGLSNFKMLFATSGSFFKSDAWIITRNTLLYNVAFIVLGIVTGVIAGICLAGIARKGLQKFFQTSILLPQLISWVIVAYIVYAFLSNETGMVNHLLGESKSINFYSTPKYWPFILIFINIWKQIGYNAIIFLSSIVGIDKGILEAARVDGCSRWQQLRHITLPLLKPTIITLAMLQVGRIFYSDFGLFYQVPLDSGALYSVTQTIDTYVYRMLMAMNNISVSSAASTYQAIVGFALVFIVNMIVRKVDKENAMF